MPALVGYNSVAASVFLVLDYWKFPLECMAFPCPAAALIMLRFQFPIYS